jgi:hypothetical protein
MAMPLSAPASAGTSSRVASRMKMKRRQLMGANLLSAGWNDKNQGRTVKSEMKKMEKPVKSTKLTV